LEIPEGGKRLQRLVFTRRYVPSHQNEGAAEWYSGIPQSRIFTEIERIAMSFFTFTYNPQVNSVDISDINGAVVYQWPLTANNERAYTMYLLTRLIGKSGARNASERDCTVVAELDEKELRIGIPKEYHRLPTKQSLWETIKSCLKKESHHARN
jgi:hypothetical protein